MVQVEVAKEVMDVIEVVADKQMHKARRRHFKAHSGARSNKCNQCDFKFIHAANLRPHLKAHSGENPNKCNRCDFTTIKADNLRNHLKIPPQHIQKRNLKDTF